jgi:hypothetical protein
MARKHRPITQFDIRRLLAHCLEREANGNKPGVPFTDNVEMRRGIIFYHSVAHEWYLRRDWRKAFNAKYPDYAIDENGPLKPRKVYPSVSAVRGIVNTLKFYDRSICYIKKVEGKWRLTRTTDEDGYTYRTQATDNYYVSDEWPNSIEAMADLRGLYDLFNQSCALCGCYWPETKRYKDAGGRWHCGCCHATSENAEITGSEPSIHQPVDATMEPMIGGKR